MGNNGIAERHARPAKSNERIAGIQTKVVTTKIDTEHASGTVYKEKAKRQRTKHCH